MAKTKHAADIEKYNGTLEELAKDIGNLRYDVLRDFLNLLATKVNHDADKDFARGRKLLSVKLVGVSRSLSNAAKFTEDVWVICEPYTK